MKQYEAQVSIGDSIYDVLFNVHPEGHIKIIGYTHEIAPDRENNVITLLTHAISTNNITNLNQV